MDGSTGRRGDGDGRGTFDLLFTMETRQPANVTVVAFEKLLHRNPETGEDVEVDRHEELDDEDQNVYELDMCTTATDVSTKSHTGNTTDVGGQTPRWKCDVKIIE